ncbi:MAG TPA: hypothetical protein PLL25_04375 [Flavobacteriales bacterium]|jgi:hypothetical protein|nr:hypothetical protein [Flavobacteriales bacterium]
MNAIQLMVDEPTLALLGTATQNTVRTGLIFTRTFGATAERLMDHWLEPCLRDQWLPLPARAHFALLAHAYPVSLQATVSDGMHTALLQLFLVEEGCHTTMRLTIDPYEPLTRDMLITAGYADRWEELLYALADALLD